MDFALSEDNLVLQQSARTFLEKEISLARVLVPGATVDDADYAGNWTKIAAMGWQGLVIEEAFGGLGLSCIDLAMILGEMGRTLAPSPFLGTLFGAWALQKGGTQEQKERILPQVADGAAKLALAVAESNGTTDSPGREAVARKQAGTHHLITGVRSFVIDAAVADWLVVAAVDEASGRRAFFLVDAKQEAVQADLLPWRDVTRQVCDVRFKNAVAEPLAVDDATLWPWLRDRILFALAAENAAGVQRVLEMTVDYAKERTAFGRPIGANQAIKHALADMLGLAECSTTAMLYAAWALSEDDGRASLAAAMAKAYSSDAYVSATHRSVQIFGAIGFTWEMKNHLYFKRARANAELFGNARAHRSRVMDMVEKKAA
ncbi:MAG: acyl-CoA dehydrogenase [Rhodospirillaceae bacterium]|jgi:acyl-CoA dehydrogenase|nr:acyl-CoA dehydrogenase [Rhodospirillaceae bacterium]